ncbi:MAG TPA: hypothetical protein VGQ05_14720 [Streptosporangiaceae bacterium]|nr:hypothetical protein [Streptosporangiaceae bacterium]
MARQPDGSIADLAWARARAASHQKGPGQLPPAPGGPRYGTAEGGGIS